MRGNNESSLSPSPRPSPIQGEGGDSGDTPSLYEGWKRAAAAENIYGLWAHGKVYQAIRGDTPSLYEGVKRAAAAENIYGLWAHGKVYQAIRGDTPPGVSS